MHLKVLLSDDLLTTGSYNFSGNAEKNAENQLTLTAPDTVAAYTDYLAEVIAAYGAAAHA
jgi:phosphatidylserine/phosphatidylglycerophosphate/cardiolipin synthase-like enzyme